MNHQGSNGSDTSNAEYIKYTAPISRVLRHVAALRTASYASDVGEATRGTLPIGFVKAMYAVTLAYVGADMTVKYLDNREHAQIKKMMGYYGVWHAQASLIYPIASMHAIVHGSKYLVDKVPVRMLNPWIRKLSPAMIAICSIPVLIHPLDKLADAITEQTYCRIADYRHTD